MAPIYEGSISVGWLSGSQKVEALSMIKKLVGQK